MKCKYEHDGDCCNAGADQYRRKCKKPCEFLWALSNADHIRSMTDEELLEFLYSCKYCDMCEEGCEECRYRGDCERRLADWLRQPYKEDT